MKVIVDKDKCIGAGQCVMTAPDVFDQDDDAGTVVLLTERPPATVQDNVRRAVNFCPARVIEVDE
ncbi:MAG TPA: ferredoxin [Streptosporangiaceae bacterium]|nr:ferredoxin [Streptosporangiaceae bacterium]